MRGLDHTGVYGSMQQVLKNSGNSRVRHLETDAPNLATQGTPAQVQSDARHAELYPSSTDDSNKFCVPWNAHCYSAPHTADLRAPEFHADGQLIAGHWKEAARRKTDTPE